METPPKVVLANAKIVRGLEDPVGVMTLLETIGRICHSSGPSKDTESAAKFVKMLIKLGHESVLEHVSVTVLVECDRAMSQQWMRHRLAAYTQESQRYVSYNEVRFVDPEFRSKNGCPHYTKWDILSSGVPDDVKALYEMFGKACAETERKYEELRAIGAPPEDARAVLPNSTRTVFYTTANLRSWRHLFEMRCAAGAQHNIRRVAKDLLLQFYHALPAVFEDQVVKFNL
jgi:thymidylate synthase (FAD)